MKANFEREKGRRPWYPEGAEAEEASRDKLEERRNEEQVRLSFLSVRQIRINNSVNECPVSIRAMWRGNLGIIFLVCFYSVYP